MFKGISLVKFCDAESGCSFATAIHGLSENRFRNLEQWVQEAVKTVDEYDTFEELICSVLDGMNVEYETICPDYFVTTG